MHACAEPCCADSPDSPTFAKPCRADSPDSPTFAEPCCADSPNSPTFAKPCCADSPDSPTLAKGHFREKCDSPRHIRTSNSPFSQIWGEWPLLMWSTINTIQKYHFELLPGCPSLLCNRSPLQFLHFTPGISATETS